MKAVIFREFGGPEVLQYEELPTPRPGEGEVLVRVHAVSVNRRFDLLVRQDGDNRGVTLPLVLGADPAGEVAEVGPGVNGLVVGDRVVVEPTIPCGDCDKCAAGREADCLHKRMMGIHRWGGYAEYVAVPARVVHRIPDNLRFAHATVVLRHFPTAFALACGRSGLQAGETALVMGAAGALGSALVQVGKLLGATVIAGAGSDERVAAARELGADFGVNYRTQDLAAECRRITDGRGVEVVFENIADPVLWPGAFDSLAYGGRLATIGAHAGGAVTLNVRRLYNQHLSVLGGATPQPADVQRSFQEAAAGRIRAVIGAVLPLEQARRAHEIVARSEVIGKVILEPPSP